MARRRVWLSVALIVLVAVLVAYGLRMGSSHPVRHSEPLAGRYDPGTATLELIVGSCAALRDVQVQVSAYLPGGGPTGDGHWEDQATADLDGGQPGLVTLAPVVLDGPDDLPVAVSVWAVGSSGTRVEYGLRADLGTLRSAGADADGPLGDDGFAERRSALCSAADLSP